MRLPWSLKPSREVSHALADESEVNAKLQSAVDDLLKVIERTKRGTDELLGVIEEINRSGGKR